VSCAAGLAVIDELVGRDLPHRAQQLGLIALDRLRTMAARHPLVAEVRGLGLLLGVVLARHADGSAASAEAEAVMYAALSRGLSFKVTMGDVLQLTPPLTIGAEELDRALGILEAAIAEVEEPLPRDPG
jgi:4-aminobutyrate aminotransferase